MGERLKTIATTYAAERNWVTFPIRKQDKRPSIPWGIIQDTQMGIDACTEADDESNICLYLGEVSGDVVDIDIDDHAALRLAHMWFPDDSLCFGRESKPRSHYLFRSSDAFTKQLRGFKADCSNHSGVIIELRANTKNARVAKGAYTVMPPSIHTSGEPIEWVNQDAVLLSFPSEYLMQIVVRIQLCVQLAQIWTQGARHDMSLAIAGTLAKARVFDEEAKKIIEGICILTGDTEIAERLVNVETTYRTLESGQSVRTLRSFEHDNQQWMGLSRWVHKACNSVTRGSDKERIVYFPEDMHWLVKRITQAANHHQLDWFELKGTGPVKIVDGHIEILTEAIMATDLCRYVDWYAIAVGGNDVQRRPSAQSLLYYLKTLPETRGLHELHGMSSNPVFNDLWELITQAGYDPTTKIFLTGVESRFPHLDISDAGVDAAVDGFMDLFEEFPFDKRDEAVSVCMLATLMVALKPTLGPTPLVFFDAPTQGAGKTFAAEVITELGSGVPARIVAMTAQREELDKMLAVLLRQASPTIVIDNVTRKVRSDLLAQVLSQETTFVRVLGTAEQAEIRSNTSLFATGVNGKIDQDIARRVLWVRMNPGIERGETLDYERDPLASVREWRGDYLADLFSIVVAYAKSGERLNLKPIASYGGKINFLREALVWAGLPDPFGALGVYNTGANEELEEVEQLFGALFDCFGGEKFSSLTIEGVMLMGSTDQAHPDAKLRHIMQSLGASNWNRANGIGKVLSKNLDSVVNNRTLKKVTIRGTVYYRLSVIKLD